MVALLRSIAHSDLFTNFITAVILFAGILVGIETYPSMVEQHGHVMHVLDKIVLWIFVAEVFIKMGAEGKQPWRYFKDPWNVFDFLIVAACFMPVDAQFVTVLRLARVLRVLKLVRALPKLQILVSALLKSIPSMGYVSLLLFILFYLYAVTATFLFAGNDPVHFESLQLSMLSLFRAVTLEDWTDLMYIQMYGCDMYGYGGIEQLCTAPAAHPVFGAIFFVTFVLIGTMIVLNLFIGVIMSGMDEAKAEQEEASHAENQGSPSLEQELQVLARQLADAQTYIARLRVRTKHLEAEIPGATVAVESLEETPPG